MGRAVTNTKAVKAKANARAHTASDRPPRSVAEDAVRTLIRWAGDNPKRPGMLGTPARVVRAYEEWFSGYAEEQLRNSIDLERVAFLAKPFSVQKLAEAARDALHPK